jgi:hypothetical protein
MTFDEWLSRTIPLDPAQQMVAKCAWEAAIKAEREACAKVCEEIRHPFGWSAETEDWTGATDNCAAAIRARKEGL